MLCAGPKIPEALPQTLRDFFTRVVVPVPSSRSVLAIAQALENSLISAEGKPILIIVLDIDAFNEGNWLADDPTFWDTLEELRVAKNLAFFGSLTAAALERLR